MIPELGLSAKCKRKSCEHAWNVHSTKDRGERCRVSGCECEGYLDIPEPETADRVRLGTMDEAVRQVEAGRMVVLVPGAPDTIDRAFLVVLRAILGNPQPGDPSVAFLFVEKVK